MSFLAVVALVVGGLVLRANPEWFNGAETAGTVCLAFGIAPLVLVGFVLVLIAMFNSR